MSEPINQEPPAIEPVATPEAIKKLSRDLRMAASTLGVREARYFVDTYYDLQDCRIAAANQRRQLIKSLEPNELISWLTGNLEFLENQIRGALDKWSGAQPMGVWARNICGIGPVISAGLLAHIDITKAPTVGHIWRYGGLDPTVKWEKGHKRPWNASLKRLLWIVGESFVKVSGNKHDVYGKLYLQRRAYEQGRDDRSELADQAAERIRKFGPKLDKSLREYLETGHLPAKALHERSKRWAVKIFLSHWHAEAYRLHYKCEPPKPYPIAILGHAHEIKP